MATKLCEATRHFNAPVAQVWAIVAAYGSEALWMPNVRKVTLEGFGIGSTRSLHIQAGPEGESHWLDEPVREVLVEASGTDHTLRWQVFNDQFGKNESYSGVRLEAVGETQTKMVWYGDTDIADGSTRENLKVFLEDMYMGCMGAIAEKLGA
ncbi:hypothetical protein ACHAQH_000307 [Verticillium albo-atrum]